MVEPRSAFSVLVPIGSPPVTGLAPTASISVGGAAFVALTTPGLVESAQPGYYSLAVAGEDIPSAGQATVRIASAQPDEVVQFQVRSLLSDLSMTIKATVPSLLAPTLAGILQAVENLKAFLQNKVVAPLVDLSRNIK